MNELEIFSAALELAEPAARARYLDETCGTNSTLRGRIEALLRNATEASQFLETPAAPLMDKTHTIASDSHVAFASPPDTDRTQTLFEPDDPNIDFLAPSDDPAAVGSIGQYTVTNVIGRGGMGIVLKARDTSLHRVVAIKVLAPELSGNPTARKRFLREARAAAAVVHQHVVTIHAVAEECPGRPERPGHSPLPYLVMEFVDGQSLQDKLDATGPLGLKETLRIGAQVAAGLAAAHAQGVVHRDIKPANILLENGVERVRITDFGLARAVDDVEITRPGEVSGTPQYMSPEQTQGQPVDARSDLFSFGSVLYAMCTGRPPFRAETTIEAIRRVCDDTPRPIREINPETPEWLIDIIARLLAKRPDERFQTAAEVAELLGQHLAHVQDPCVRPPLFSPRAPGQKAVRATRAKTFQRGAAAAMVLLIVLAVLGATEATGVTQLAGSVIRIVTGDGTLVIDVDDPGVQVSLDGEVLTIKGGGVEQVRLRPGQYQFTATKDGRPVKQELVSITRGGQKVVTVSREGVPPAGVTATPQVESGAFVILGGKDVPERTFDTLSEAVAGASDGNTIEVRGNGPFVTDPIIVNHALTLRAATGFRAVILLEPELDKTVLVLLRATSPLALEGLEFRRTARNDEGRSQAVIQSVEKISLVNCRLLATSRRDCLWSKRGLVVHNSELLVTDPNNMTPVSWDPGLDGRAVIDNCVIMGPILSKYKGGPLSSQTGSIHLRHNTCVATDGFRFDVLKLPPALRAEQPSAAIEAEFSRNVFDLRRSMLTFNQAALLEPFEAATADALLRRFLDCHDEQNLHGSGSRLCTFCLVDTPVGAGKDLGEWNRFWGLSETGTFQGSIRFQGGNLFARAQADVQQFTPEDFRLRPDSAGYRAGPDGKDLGADIDFVGPGAAYERWKKTPAYQEWLNETGQVK